MNTLEKSSFFSITFQSPNGLSIKREINNWKYLFMNIFLTIFILGYNLSDNSAGVLYNDSTRMILHQNGEQLTYLDKDFAETVFPKSNYPQDLKKKVSLIDYFRKYMNEHLLKV